MKVSDFLLHPLHEWGVKPIYGYAGNGFEGWAAPGCLGSDQGLVVIMIDSIHRDTYVHHGSR